jgi:hypothetical protein
MQAVRLVARENAPPIGAWLAGSAGLGALLVRLLGLDRLPFPVCTFKALTGLPCMSCGSTRAFGLLGRLDLAGALRMQPLATLAALAILLWGLVDLALRFRRRALRLECTHRQALWLTWIALGLVLVNWAYLLVFLR